jgi:hypothetical protein
MLCANFEFYQVMNGKKIKGEFNSKKILKKIKGTYVNADTVS